MLYFPERRPTHISEPVLPAFRCCLTHVLPLVWLVFRSRLRDKLGFIHRRFLQVFFQLVLSLTCFFYSVFNLLSLWTQLQKRERSCRAYVQVFLVLLIHMSSYLTE